MSLGHAFVFSLCLVFTGCGTTPKPTSITSVIPPDSSSMEGERPASRVAMAAAREAARTPVEKADSITPTDWGPIYSRHTDLAGIQRTRAVGPIFERAESAAGDRFLAVRPFYSDTRDATRKKELKEFIWPLGAYKKFAGDIRWWFLTYMGWIYDVDTVPEGERVYKRWLLPFYFAGRTRAGEEYQAVFPIHGTLRDFLGRDEINWTFFPIFFRNRVNDVQAETWFWPIYSHTKGEGVERFRVFPFYGWSQWRDDVRRTFVLWPFWNHATFTYENAPGSAFMLWPFYGEVRSPNEGKVVRWVLPPFFRFETGGESQKNHLPWPLYQSQTGPNINKWYLFPLYGHKAVGKTESRFVLWPIFLTFHSVYKNTERNQAMALPFFQHDVLRQTGPDAAAGVAGEKLEEKLKLWPLFSYRREKETARWRFLDLWVLHQTRAIERNYSPLWTLASHLRVGEDAHETEVLWGMWRSIRRGPDDSFTSLFPLFDRTQRPDGGRAWNIGKGLVGREVQGGASHEARWRLLWFLSFGGGQ